MPPPSALPSRYRSGTTPTSSHANVAPTRPRPDWISSAMSSTFRSRVSSRSDGRKSAGGTTMPDSPWIGSTSTATVFSSMAAATAAASPYGTIRNPGVYGPKSSCASGSSLNEMIVVVRPWKLPAITMMFAASGATPFTR